MIIKQHQDEAACQHVLLRHAKDDVSMSACHLLRNARGSIMRANQHAPCEMHDEHARKL